MLKVVGTHHHRVRSDASDVREDYEETAAGNSMYRIKDHVYYSLDLVQHVPDRGWVPADKTLDIQVAFRMLDPYITAHLAAEDAANYTHPSRAIRAVRLRGSLRPSRFLTVTACLRCTSTSSVPDCRLSRPRIRRP